MVPIPRPALGQSAEQAAADRAACQVQVNAVAVEWYTTKRLSHACLLARGYKDTIEAGPALFDVTPLNTRPVAAVVEDLAICEQAALTAATTPPAQATLLDLLFVFLGVGGAMAGVPPTPPTDTSSQVDYARYTNHFVACVESRGGYTATVLPPRRLSPPHGS